MNGERSALAFAEEEGMRGGENVEERGEERGERQVFFLSPLSSPLSSAFSPPLFPFSSPVFIALLQMPRSLDVSHWKRTHFVSFSLHFKGAPCD